MICEPLGVFCQSIWIALFDGAYNAGVQELASVMEQGAVGDFMSKCMLESVLGVGEKTSLIHKLRRLQMREPPPDGILGRLRYGLEQDERNVLADDGGRLEQLLVLRRKPVDAGRQNDLDGRRNLNGMDRPSQAVRAALTRERTRL